MTIEKNSSATESINELDIAVIGMSCRVPGADNIERFWQNLCQGVESINLLSDAALNQAGVDSKLINDPNYVPASADIQDIEFFDAEFFGYSRREAEIMDPQQRLFLQAAWQALEHAGYHSANYDGAIGVYASAGMNQYYAQNIYPNMDLSDPTNSYLAMLGNDKDFLSTRISYKLNLKGPSVTVQTACSSSLVAVHQAIQSILNGESDMALAGGVSLPLPLNTGYLYREGMIASPDGHCRPFDKDAQGTVFGSGLGIVVLKSLTTAIRDGDHIHATIKGSAINNDGADKIAYTAPSIQGQANAISEALAIAAIDPVQITLLEAHGTATAAGDPIEIAALTEAFSNEKVGYCAIASVKSNIGHLDAAAGVVGLIKNVLCLEHKQIPPSLNFKQANPEINFANSPFYVNTQLQTWQHKSTPRCAGVSSFGIGGTNAHVVLQEAPAKKHSESSQAWHLIMLSARTPKALETSLANLAKYLQQQPAQSLPDIAFTLQQGRQVFDYKYFFVVNSKEQLKGQIQDLISEQRKETPEQKDISSGQSKAKNLAFVFPPQCPIALKSLQELIEHEPNLEENFPPHKNESGQYHAIELLQKIAEKAAFLFDQITSKAKIIGARGSSDTDRPSNPVHKVEQNSTALGFLGDSQENMRAQEFLLQTLGRLWFAGITIDISALYATEARNRLALPTYPFDEKYYWIAKSPEKKAVNQAIQEPIQKTATCNPNALDKHFYQLFWQTKALQKNQSAQPKNPGHWLIFADQAGLGLELSTVLQAQGEQVQLIMSQAEMAESEKITAIDPLDGNSYLNLLSQYQDNNQLLRGVVHLWSLESPPNQDLTASKIEDSMQLQCSSAMLLTQALQQLQFSHAPLLWFVTRDAIAAGSDKPQLSGLAQSALWGFARVVSLEHPEFWGGIIDLSANENKKPAAKKLVQEFFSPQDEDQVIFRNDERLVPRIKPQQIPQLNQQSDNLAINPDGYYVISGGLGFLGLKSAQWLAKQGAKHLVLVGRKAFPEPARWSSLVNDEKYQKTIIALQDIEHLGCKITLVQADIGQQKQFNQAMQEAMQRAMQNKQDMQATISKEQPLRGIIHAAGIIANQPIQEMYASDLIDIAKSKTLGAWILHEWSLNSSPDFFLAYSSASSIWGAQGQAHYAAANQFLDSLMLYRQTLGLPASGINWGPFDGTGMGSPETTQWLGKNGIKTLKSEQLGEYLEVVLAHNLAQVLVADMNWEQFALTYSAKKNRPILNSLLEDETLAPGKTSQSNKLDLNNLRFKLEQQSAAQQQRLLIEEIQKIVKQVIGQTENLPLEQGFTDMGLDSLMAVELRSRLQNSLQLSLPVTIAFNKPTIAMLAEYIGTLLSGNDSNSDPNIILDKPREADKTALGKDVATQLSQAEMETAIQQELDKLRDLINDE